MSIPYEINRELVCSTAHITFEDSIMIGNLGCVEACSYGWRLYVGDDSDVFDGEISNLKALAAIARSLDCVWLVLDQDGPIYPNMPTYEW